MTLLTVLGIPTTGKGSLASSWVYLADWVLALFLSVGFIFYFARLVGFVLTLLLRLFVWRKRKVRISMDAFRISPLGGRISARNVVITTADHTISMVRVNLTWRYWLVRFTRLADFVFGPHESGEEHDGPSRQLNKAYPTSIHLLIDGLEVFVYNRKVAYENIVEALRKADGETEDPASVSDSLSASSSAKMYLGSSSGEVDSHSSGPALGFLLKVFPVQVQIKKGAMVLGNATTPSILCASYQLATSILDLGRSPCLLDPGRISLDTTFEKFQISVKPNGIYDPQRYSSEDSTQNNSAQNNHPTPLPKDKRLRKIRELASRLIRFRKKRTEPNYDEWRGLRRYVDTMDEEKVVEISDIEEYAKYSMILDSSSTRVVYYYDIPGVHPPADLDNSTVYPLPQFGVDIFLSLATIHYGSWTDRQRGPIQKMLFPIISRDSKASPTINEPGSPRSYGGFNLKLIALDELIFRLPTREFSKDRVDLANHVGKRQKNTRPFGWLELKLAPNTTLSSFTSYLATKNGFPNTLSMSMIKPEVRSSVNHDILFIADEHTMDCDIGFPLEWNGKCVWKFHQKSKKGMFFLLREHVFLLTDLIADFASGEPAPYEYFRPFEYQLNWDVDDYSLFFNVNDHNIINDPLDFDSNKYLCFSGKKLDVSCVIPTQGNFSKSFKVDYKVSTTSLDLDLEVPPWHTVSTFMKGRKRMGSTEGFEISGYYNGFNSVEVNQNNFVVINAIGDKVTLIFYGYFIKYLFTFRENYFGDFKHFKTFEEYSNTQHHGRSPEDTGDVSSTSTTFEDTPDYWKILKTENDLNVLFTFLVRSGLIVLPCGIYNCQRHIGLTFNNLDVDIHLTHFYMDLQADFSSAQGYMCDSPNDGLAGPDIWNIQQYREIMSQRVPDITIDCFSIHTHRMFGLAPDLLTYYCKWDFASGAIMIDCDPVFLVGLKITFQNFIFGYKDLENALIYNIPVIYDFANFSFRCPEIVIRVTTGVENTYLQVSLPDVLVNFNDIANERFSSKFVISLPEIHIRIIKDGDNPKHEAYLRTSLTFTNFCQKAKMLQHRIYQQRFGRRSDAPTHRVPFLLYPEYKDDIYMNAKGSLFHPTSLPTASKPITRELAEIQADNDSIIGEEADTDSDFSLEDLDKFDPTVDYYDEDFMPQTPIRQGYKNDSYVFELGAVEAFFSPSGGKAMTSLTLLFQALDLDILMDRIQVEAINQLRRLILPISMIDNIRFVCPSIELRLVEQGIFDLGSVLCRSPDVPVITISIIEPSLAFSQVRTRTRKISKIVEETSTCSAFHLREIYMSVHDPHYFTSALTFQLKDLEGWKVTDENSDDIIHLTVGELKTAIEPIRVQWTVSLIAHFAAEFKNAFKDWGIASETSRVWRGELILALITTVGEENMQHDPSVITKPAAILRSCDDHVRFYDSWKIVTKLRSILSFLPIFDELELKFKNRDWAHRSNSLEQVMDYFGNWRPWEGDATQRSEYFSGIFGNDSSSQANVSFFFKLTQAEFTVNETESPTDSLLLHGITVVYDNNDDKDRLYTEKVMPFSGGKKSVVANIEAFDSTFSPVTCEIISCVSNIADNFQSRDAQLNAKNQEDAQSLQLLIQLLINIKLFHFRFNFPLTFVECYTYDNVSSLETYPLSGFNVINQSKEFNVSFGKGELDNVDISLSGLRLAYIMATELLSSNVLEATIQGLEIKLSDQNDTLHSTISEFIDHDLDLITGLLPAKLEETRHEKSTETVAIKEDFLVTLLIENADYYFDFIHPLRLHGFLTKSKLLLSFQHGVFAADYYHKSISWDAALLDVTILHIEHSNMRLKSFAENFRSIWFLKLTQDLGYLKINLPLVVNATDITLQSIPMLKEKIEKLKAVSSKLNSADKKILTSKKSEASPALKIALDARVSQKYCGLSIFNGNCRHTLEFEDLRSRISNVIDGNELAEAIVPYWGELSLRETRMIVLDSLLPVGLSTLLDLNLSLKVLNDATSTYGTSSHSIQLESQHFRVCLSPPVLFKLFEVTDGFSRILQKHRSLLNELKANHNNEKKVTQAPVMTPKEKPFRFSSVHVLSYNFCVGWLFGTPHKDYPGFILGAERFFAVLKKDLGKLSLMEGYLSVANGSSSSSFYSTLSEYNNLNRAFMPKVQLNYLVADDDSLFFSLKGDVLDVRCVSNSIIMIERAIESATKVRKYFEDRFQKQRRRKSIAAELKVDIKPKNSSSPYFSKFKKFQFTTTFAGAKVFVYRLLEEDETNRVHGSAPSLYLHSPAILVLICYEYSKNKEKRHSVKTEILMSQSDNTLYPSCVPILKDITEASKLIFRPSKPNPSAISSRSTSGKLDSPPPQSLPPSEEANDNITQMLNDVDFQIGFIVEKQRLSLSCEPTAKVAAVVEFDGASILACTGIEEICSIYILTQINPVTASLQHIYSDDKSGFVSIKNIMFSNVLTFNPSVEITSSLYVRDISCHVRMKQYQDLDLFKDIWFPKQFTTPKENVEVTEAKSTYSKWKQVSSTYAIPFWLTIIISNFSLEVDFGTALGIVALDVDRAWTISRKSSNWLYELKLGLQNLKVGSEGRLGGYLKLEHLFMTSSVEWKLEEMPLLDIPLVHVTGGFDSFQVKTAFDNHYFAFAILEGFRLDAFNRKNGINISKDHLFVLTKYDAMDVMITSLAASEFFDIYNTIHRMIEENKTSYSEILKDSNKEHIMETVSHDKPIDVAKKLETKIEVSTGVTRIQVYPYSFDDKRALSIVVGKSNASFLQNEYVSKVANEIEIRLSNVNASLATTVGVPVEAIPGMEVQELVENARKASGGGILGFPKFMISMRTYEKYNSNIIEYLFQSSFGGTVDIRWNLGSVNLIREMYAVHKRALQSRTGLSEHTALEQAEERMSEGDENQEIDKDLKKTLERVTAGSKYVYKALAPPVIETPQLKELGNATPPLEWFGLHRSKFPDATHQSAIVTMQKLIHEIEEHYSKALGHV